MLQETTIKETIGLAEDLANRGITLVSKPNTVIADLTRFTSESVTSGWLERFAREIPEGSTDSVAQPKLQAGDDVSIFAGMLEAITKGTLEEPSQHDLTLDGYIDSISKHVLRHINFAKNVVRPIVVDYADKVTQAMSRQTVPDAASQFNIIVKEVPGILEEESFLASVESYEGRPALVPKDKPKLSAKTIDEIKALLVTGDSQLDALVQIFMTQVGEDFLFDVYHSFFTTEPPIRQYYSGDDVIRMNALDQLQVGVTVYLLSKRLFDQVDATVTGQTLLAYQTHIAEIRDFAGAILASALNKVQAFNRSQVIILNVNSRERTVVVYGKTYRKWLDEGGKPETILGMVISDRSYYTASLIDSHTLELADSFRSYQVFYNNTSQTRALEIFKDILKNVYLDIMSNLTEDEKAYINDHSDYQALSTRRLEEQIAQVFYKDMSDIQSTCLRVVCQARFYYTDAGSILGEMQQAALINPNLDPREAALIATIYYLTDYIADQIDVVRA